MGSNLRHFKALMRKNFINWKRTPLGSALELLTPCLLMLMLVLARQGIKPTLIDSVDLGLLQHPKFPVSSFNSKDNSWNLSAKAFLSYIEDDAFQNMMRYANYTNTALNSTKPSYNPVLDVKAPFLFNPPHCIKQSGIGFKSPIIAYLKSDSPLQKDMIEQLQDLFQQQRQMGEFLQSKSSEFDLSALVGSQQKASSNFFKGTQTQVSDKIQLQDWAYQLKEFKSKEDLFAYIQDKNFGSDEVPAVCFGFTIHEKSKNDVELELFFNDFYTVADFQSIPSQRMARVPLYANIPQIQDYALWEWYGFGYMQNWVANTILKRRTGVDDAKIVQMSIPMRMQPFVKDDFKVLLQTCLSIIAVVMFIPAIYRCAYRIAQEKEMKTKESMYMMGLKAMPYWLSWYVYYVMVMTVLSLLAWSMMFFIFTQINMAILFLHVYSFALSLFGIVMAVQAFFSKARIAAIVSATIFILLLMPWIFTQQENENSQGLMWGISICPPSAFGLTTGTIVQFESSKVKVDWSSINEKYKGWSVRDGLIIQFANIPLWLLIGIYFEAVAPKEYGKSLKPWFLCLPSFWCSRKPQKQQEKKRDRSIIYNVDNVDESQSELNAAGATDLLKEQQTFETKYMNPDFYEPVPAEIGKQELNNTHLKIKDLFKEYKNGFKAVNGINLQMYKDQIFVLLGHNGAGKTTTISMLTGLFAASQGEAQVYGVDMFNQTDQLREFMGVCPQHEVLFELLTPEEHLDIFYDFKGADPNPEVKWAEINKLMKDVGVDDKRHHITSQLSGGNQRKVSVCVALCGNSKFVLLDEPSSGLDLSARRQMWNMLKEHKKDKIIILTTHYMDEADILGDRIAIMSGGRITCLGTSMFLKHRFGVGYTMTIVKTTNLKNKTVLPFIRRNLGPDVKKLTEVHQEMTFQIPKKYSEKFKLFFKVFDFQLASLQIQSYGISITTLEEVFLKVGHLSDPSKAIQEIDEKQDENEFDPCNPLRTYSHQAYGQQEMMDFNQRMEEFLFKKKGQQDDVVTSQLLDPSSAKKDTENESADFSVDDPSPLSHIENRPSDLIGLKKDQSVNPMMGKIDEDEVVEDSVSENPDHDSDNANMRRVVSEIQVNKYESLFEKETLAEAKYNLKNAKLDRSFCYHLSAFLQMRWNTQKRNYKGLVNELLLPALIALFGLAVTSFNFYIQSESHIVSANLFPSPQKLLVNQMVYDKIGSDTSAQMLWDNIPEFEKSFEPFYAENYGLNMTYNAYQNAVSKHARDYIKEYPYLYGAFEAFQLNRKTQQYKFFTFLNMTCSDCGEVYPQYAYESILKIATNDPQFKFKIRNTPYPLTAKLLNLKAGTDSAVIVFMASLSVSVLSAMVVGYIVSERIKNLKHMQTMTGLRLDAYWVGNFIVDFIKFVPIILVMTAGAKLLKKNHETSVYSYLVFPLSDLAFLYSASFLFNSESSAQTVILFYSFLIGSITPGMVMILRLNQKLCNIGDVINWVLRFTPCYALSNSLFFDANGKNLPLYRNGGGFGRKVSPDPLHWENNIADVICMLISGVFWIIVLIALETGLLEKISDLYEKSIQSKYPKEIERIEKDEDVRVEENRVRKKKDNQLEIKVQDFRKCYMIGKGPCNPLRPFLAVEKLSFGLSVGECFCLLGVNGAGKSTTFKSLTCEVKPTAGKITITGFDIQRDWAKVRQLIGYCPQTNPIFETMSVEEHIDYYAKVKGINAKEKGVLIEEAIKELGLEMHRSKEAGNLSGGNKRKLSVAIAIIGNPQIILLDEPSAGMDPESRRFMWQVIAKISNEKTSAVILTTHLMEEAEALSTKMGIMVKGGIFKCFGSSQHIKNKFGTGYVIDVKIRQPTQEEIQQLIDEELPDSKQTDIHGNKLISIKAAQSQLSKAYSKYIVDYVFDDIHPVETAQMTRDRKNARGRQLKVVKESEFVSAQDIAVSLFTQNACIATIEELCQVFGQVELLEKYGGFMSMRVARQQKTIGFVFGYLDEIKGHCDISEYSVSQTSLEQIFQSFANLKFDEQCIAFSLDSETGDLVKQ